MSDDRIAAEVEPTSGNARRAAARMEELGFRIYHVGPTISVEGPRSLWEERFDVVFEEREKPGPSGVDEDRSSYLRARTDRMEIPEELRAVIAEIYFAEPPEFF